MTIGTRTERPLALADRPVGMGARRIVLMLAHSIEEHDQLKLLTELGYEVFSIGAYTDPAQPDDDKRPPLPKVPYYAELAAACRRQRETRGDPGPLIDWAKAALPDEVLAWADTIIVHHFTPAWLLPQWARFRDWGGRVIWRTTGQSNPTLEEATQPLRAEGLEIVRYSPMEKFLPNYIGADAMIRFYADPDVWTGWTGDHEVVGNVTQNMAERGNATGHWFWEATTNGLPTRPVGPGSEHLRGGLGELPYNDLRTYLRKIRCYLYTGTVPASYTLGLIEALMTGVPVVSIGPTAWGWWSPFGADLFEGHLLTPLRGEEDLLGLRRPADDPVAAKRLLRHLLEDEEYAQEVSEATRANAILQFGKDRIGDQWRDYLG